MGKNFMLERGRVKIWLAGRGSAKLEAAGKPEPSNDTDLPRVHKASQAISQMPTRPSSSHVQEPIKGVEKKQ